MAGPIDTRHPSPIGEKWDEAVIPAGRLEWQLPTKADTRDRGSATKLNEQMDR
ncbi:hypothetical protein [Sphingomonas glacialis]|uniref:hypothetical protein n=1 Tax=Sphingomonas glacialis TaxID=658225 RepID=UPI001672DD2F|nr:hypothetical protein [Sphingomonas glacialis]